MTSEKTKKYSKGKMIKTLDEFYKVYQAREHIYYEWWNEEPKKHKILDFGFYQNMTFRTIIILIKMGNFYKVTKKPINLKKGK